MRKSKMIEENTDKKLNSKKEKNSIEGTLELPRRQSEDKVKTKHTSRAKASFYSTFLKQKK